MRAKNLDYFLFQHLVTLFAARLENVGRTWSTRGVGEDLSILRPATASASAEIQYENTRIRFQRNYSIFVAIFQSFEVAWQWRQTLRLHRGADGLVPGWAEQLLIVDAAVAPAVVVAARVAAVGAGHAEAVPAAVLEGGQVVVEKVASAAGSGHAEHRVWRHPAKPVIHQLLMMLLLLLLMLLLLLLVVMREGERTPDSAAFELELGRSRDPGGGIRLTRGTSDLLEQGLHVGRHCLKHHVKCWGTQSSRTVVAGLVNYHKTTNLYPFNVTRRGFLKKFTNFFKKNRHLLPNWTKNRPNRFRNRILQKLLNLWSETSVYSWPKLQIFTKSGHSESKFHKTFLSSTLKVSQNWIDGFNVTYFYFSDTCHFYIISS